ncbi:DUF7344 domain-containing protein [Halovivax limisalsi]|uniref:DUF7344 domain-containing protein n=1 Tax=Halovivax limisalsi TaxID=1453760 RepID=UPI001FFDDA51|nr:hypothetical protein [Halovivax limisalsi]
MAEAELSRAELFDVFSNARRRLAVRFLTERDGTCDLTPLVEYVAAQENDVDRNEVTRAQRRRVYISLYQTHLPMLADHGIVEWVPDAHRIELLLDDGVFEPYLATDPRAGREWYRAYAALAICAVAAVGVGVLVPGPSTPVVTASLAILVAGLFLIVALVQRVERTNRL